MRTNMVGCWARTTIIGLLLVVVIGQLPVHSVEIIYPSGQSTAIDLPSSTGEANANIQALLETPSSTEYEIADGCLPFMDPNEFTGSIVLLPETSACSFTVQATNVKNANALGLILANNAGNSVKTISTNVQLPTVYIGLDDYMRLSNLLVDNAEVKVRISTFTNCFFDEPDVPCANSGAAYST